MPKLANDDRPIWERIVELSEKLPEGMMKGPPDPIAAAVQAERERCIAWLTRTIDSNTGDILFSESSDELKRWKRDANAELRYIRQRIESGETP
jgi:hypothetical protein